MVEGNQRYYTVKQASRVLQCCTRTVRRWIYNDGLPGTCTVDGRHLIPVEAVMSMGGGIGVEIFFRECCIFEEGSETTSKQLNGAYRDRCDRNGEEPRSAKALARALRQRGCMAHRGAKGMRSWRGIRLRRLDEPVEGG